MAAVKLHRHVGRRRTGHFLVEGPNLVEAALRRGCVVDVFATESAVEKFAAMLADTVVHEVTDRAAKALCDTVTPVGLVAVCSMPAAGLADVLAGGPHLVAVGAALSEPGNAGTMIRIADAMAADAVVLAGSAVDPYNAKCLRASAGSIFSVPVITHPDAVGAVTAMRDAGLHVLAATVAAERSLEDPDLDLAQPTAWLFGSEAHGLPADVAACAAHRVRIQMPGRAESLNVASAAAICLYQSARALHRT